MNMDPWLAQVYGTNGGAAEDLEKIAQAEMAQQMAQNEGVDLSGLTEDQIAALGQEVLGQGGEQGAAAQGQPEGGGIDPSQITEELFGQAQEILQAAQQGQQVDPAALQEAQAIMQAVEHAQAQQAGQQTPETMAKVAEAQAKFEEADFLGRVMAHSFNQEAEKIAASKQAGAAEHLKNLGGAVKRHVGNAAHHVSSKAQQAGGHMKLRAHAFGHAVKQHPVTHGAVGAAGLGAGYALGHHMAKEATVAAIEKAAMQQAANILQANGIDPTTGQPVQQTQQVQQPAAPVGGAGTQAALGDLVEKRAHQILRGLGYSI